jgi:hypothetical protein
MHLDNFDPAVAHLLHKVEMVTLGVLDPDHVVEQQLIAVGGRKTQMGAPWRANHHLAQLADLGVHAVFRALSVCHDGLPSPQIVM